MEIGDKVSFFIFENDKFKLETGFVKKIRKPNNNTIITVKSNSGQIYYKSKNKLTKL